MIRYEYLICAYNKPTERKQIPHHLIINHLNIYVKCLLSFFPCKQYHSGAFFANQEEEGLVGYKVGIHWC